MVRISASSTARRDSTKPLRSGCSPMPSATTEALVSRPSNSVADQGFAKDTACKAAHRDAAEADSGRHGAVDADDLPLRRNNGRLRRLHVRRLQIERARRRRLRFGRRAQSGDEGDVGRARIGNDLCGHAHGPCFYGKGRRPGADQPERTGAHGANGLARRGDTRRNDLNSRRQRRQRRCAHDARRSHRPPRRRSGRAAAAPRRRRAWKRRRRARRAPARWNVRPRCPPGCR